MNAVVENPGPETTLAMSSSTRQYRYCRCRKASTESRFDTPFAREREVSHYKVKWNGCEIEVDVVRPGHGIRGQNRPNQPVAVLKSMAAGASDVDFSSGSRRSMTNRRQGVGKRPLSSTSPLMKPACDNECEGHERTALAAQEVTWGS